jgi:hypothetical protein
VEKREGKEQGASKKDSMRKKRFFFKIKEDGVCGVRSTNETNIYKPGVNKPRTSI